MADAAIVEALSATDLFGSLGKRTVGKIADQCKTVHHPAGKAVATEGGGATGLHLIASGTAAVTVNDEHRRTLNPGDYFGEISLIDGLPRSATVVAETALVTYSLVAWAFTPILESEPEVGNALLKVMCARLRAAEKA